MYQHGTATYDLRGRAEGQDWQSNTEINHAFSQWAVYSNHSKSRSIICIFSWPWIGVSLNTGNQRKPRKPTETSGNQRKPISFHKLWIYWGSQSLSNYIWKWNRFPLILLCNTQRFKVSFLTPDFHNFSFQGFADLVHSTEAHSIFKTQTQSWDY